ncbi:MAG TPA: MBL fold metallo-hydrolase [Candidatus Polarisedimenticolia bacterium]|nr:MBL fold metallo-hydrolase [Candidatus Polarisedimenticolia bacterium]
MTGRGAAAIALLAPAACLGCPAGAARAAAAPAVSVHAVVLGNVQDGGLPHLGCARECCERARRDPAASKRVASLGLIARPREGSPRLFLLDATPDIRSQIDSLTDPPQRAARPAGLPVDGILLTHAHVGHYTGLMYLGKESMAARGVPVHATARMAAFLSAGGPWRRLLEGGHVALRPMTAGEPIVLAPGLSVTPIRVAHREEDSDAMGFLVAGPSRRLLYIPDIDAWERWETDIATLAATVDVALLDGTFHGPEEVPGRSLADVPHPTMLSTMDRLAAAARAGCRILFIHLNHTNPALWPGSAERRALRERGFDVAEDGLRLEL